jgi:hypothetical protein
VTDMRKGFDGLAVLVQQHLGQDPFSGQLFAFRGRRGQQPTFCIQFTLRDDCLPMAPPGRADTPSSALAINAFLAHHNADPKPFRWIKSAEDILAAVERFCTYNTSPT